jgi:hypothetical protein
VDRRAVCSHPPDSDNSTTYHPPKIISTPFFARISPFFEQ